jgi:hypothetical protein
MFFRWFLGNPNDLRPGKIRRFITVVTCKSHYTFVDVMYYWYSNMTARHASGSCWLPIVVEDVPYRRGELQPTEFIDREIFNYPDDDKPGYFVIVDPHEPAPVRLPSSIAVPAEYPLEGSVVAVTTTADGTIAPRALLRNFARVCATCDVTQTFVGRRLVQGYGRVKRGTTQIWGEVQTEETFGFDELAGEADISVIATNIKAPRTKYTKAWDSSTRIVRINKKKKKKKTMYLFIVTLSYNPYPQGASTVEG